MTVLKPIICYLPEGRYAALEGLSRQLKLSKSGVMHLALAKLIHEEAGLLPINRVECRKRKGHDVIEN